MSNLTNSEIRNFVNEIIKFKNSNFMQNIKSTNEQEYFNIMNSTFKNFKLNYETMFNVIIKEDNLDNLFLMLDMKDKIDNGSNKKKIEKEIAEELANQFVKKKN